MKKLIFLFIFSLIFIYGCSNNGDREDASIDTFFPNFDSSGCEIVTLDGHTVDDEHFFEYACEADKMDYIQNYAQNLNTMYPGGSIELTPHCGYWHHSPFGYAYASVDADHSGKTGIDISKYSQNYAGEIIVRFEKYQ